MSSSPTWLATLQRVREYRRDAALQLLAQQLQAATKIRNSAAEVESNLARQGQAQQQSSYTGRLDSDRLRQLRLERDSLRSELSALSIQRSSADTAVRQAQVHATAKDAEAEVLRRLQDRLDSTQRQEQRRRDDQSSMESAVSLCNGQRSD